MVSIGYFLASESFGPHELVRQAKAAERAGFERLWISDHYHPWTGAQGHSPFVWSVLGALSEATSLPVTTAVTCPLIRTHPAVIAQAAATAGVQCRGGFTLGVGTGEALNEHITGERWPPPAERIDMLTEAIDIIRALHRGGEVSYRGEHFTVEHARVYTLPDEPVPINVAAFGPRAARVAGRYGDGFCTVVPDAELVREFREAGGTGPAQGGMKVCWADTEAEGAATAHRLWPNEVLPGALPSTLPRPRDFEQAASVVTEDMLRERFACGPDPQRHLDQVRQYLDAGFDEIYVQQMGERQDDFFAAWSEHVLPKIRAS
ncbi:G6PDH family F420-dependent oxidoreductase [Prauserella shujinwangii]|uniref:G6PDH family F420-dependent oxidoreductase n=1 Tax=Prauserella shujinwangii TaxID=1453103 RepID=A0A2T0LSD4_9PSEU|nr:TIGR03557 family F420-dependent LLM class oxidoreductase [Prauserella shujinwangii]PRX46525.1 G6PDH family F420-dependent oxidoreductase [Prauserella shujinwangii]